MADQMTKTRFIEMLRSERAHWEDLVSKIEDTQMTEAGVEGKWSALDVVAHITAYERWLVEWLKAASEGHLPPRSPLDDEDVEKRNAWIYEQNRGRPLHIVWIESQKVFEELIERLEALDERDLWDTKRTSWFVKPYYKDNRPLWQCIAGDTYEHYHQHAPAIRTFLAKLWSG